MAAEMRKRIRLSIITSFTLFITNFPQFLTFLSKEEYE
jgi:hypothetical protein